MLYFKEKSSLEQFINPQSKTQFFVYVILAILINIFSNQLNFHWIFSLFLFGGLFLYIYIAEHNYTRKRIEKLSLSIIKESPQPAEGLILLLSPFNSFNRAIDREHLSEKIEKLIAIPNPELLLFDEIGISPSNLETNIAAIEYHVQKGSLKNIWLITSKSLVLNNGAEIKGSEITAKLLEKYIMAKYPEQRLEIHYEANSVHSWDYKGLLVIIEKIYRKAKIKPEHILTDITGGTKMMSVAAAFACVPPNRKMQYMAADRDWEGNPILGKAIEPVLIDVDPALYDFEKTV